MEATFSLNRKRYRPEMQGWTLSRNRSSSGLCGLPGPAPGSGRTGPTTDERVYLQSCCPMACPWPELSQAQPLFLESTCGLPVPRAKFLRARNDDSLGGTRHESGWKSHWKVPVAHSPAQKGSALLTSVGSGEQASFLGRRSNKPVGGTCLIVGTMAERAMRVLSSPMCLTTQRGQASPLPAGFLPT